MIRATALLSLLVVPLLAAAAAPAGAATLAAAPASARSLLRFDVPGHQAADVTPVAYRCRYRHHHRYCYRR